MRKHFLDLFSGFGGASEAFTQDLGNWTVLRIDNNPLLSGVPFTVIDDIKLLANDLNPGGMFPRTLEKIECIWASPPCVAFSNAYSSPKSIHIREHGIESYKPDMSLLIAAMEIIETVKPKYWVIENVVGAIRYFQEFLGEPRQIIGPYVLWGNFPILDLDESSLTSKAKKDVKHSSHPLRSNYKAKVDFEISAALKRTIETQQSILDY
jgi:hypothetical protein